MEDVFHSATRLIRHTPMSYKNVRNVWVAFLVTSTGAAALVAQSTRRETANGVPSHQHYVHSELATQAAPNGQLAPRLQNLGTHVFPVSTTRADAQLYINQGINLSYAFNHAEAGRSFREAARLDPDLGMAYWGQALVLGPNINAPMNPDDERAAHRLLRRRGRAQRARPRRSARSSTRSAPATPATPPTGGQTTRPTRRPCAPCTSGSRTIWMSPCSTSKP